VQTHFSYVVLCKLLTVTQGAMKINHISGL